MSSALKLVGVVFSVVVLGGVLLALAHGKYGLAVGLVAIVIGATVCQKIVELEKRVTALEKEVERRPLRD
jgi:hypothetical protein